MLHFIFQGNVYHTEDLMNSQTNQDFSFFLFFFFFNISGYTFISGGHSLSRVLCGQAVALWNYFSS